MDETTPPLGDVAAETTSRIATPGKEVAEKKTSADDVADETTPPIATSREEVAGETTTPPRMVAEEVAPWKTNLIRIGGVSKEIRNISDADVATGSDLPTANAGGFLEPS